MVRGTIMKHGQTHGGKGSTRRNANDKAYADNWDKIFGKTKDLPQTEVSKPNKEENNEED